METVIDGWIFGIYIGLVFLLYMMFMFYLSLKFRLRRLSREMEYIQEDLIEIRRDKWKFK